MKIFKKTSVLLFSTLLILGLTSFTACEGPAGPEGLQGEVGPVGPAGDDGSQMYAGTGSPASDIGDIGDYYLNTNTGEYYGPKDSNGWGNPIIVLMGNDGVDGEDGSQIFSGTGTPASSLGQEGDYYLDKSSFDLYGPKTASGWGMPLNIKGADGNANVTLYVFNAADYTSSSSSNTVGISGIDFSELYESQWNFAFKRGIFMQFIPGKISWSNAGSHSEFTVELSYNSTTGDVEFTIELIGGPDYYPDQLHIFRTVPSTINKQAVNEQKKTFKLPSLEIQETFADMYGFQLEE